MIYDDMCAAPKWPSLLMQLKEENACEPLENVSNWATEVVWLHLMNVQKQQNKGEELLS